MAVVSSWSFGPFKLEVSFSQRINADITKLDNGGYAVMLQGPVSSLLLIIDPNGSTSTAVISAATNARVKQNADGNLVVAYEKDGETFTQVRGLNGASVVGETPLGGPGSSDPDVSDCTHFAWSHFNPGSGDKDIFLDITNDGVYSPDVAVATGLDLDQKPQSVCLQDGGIGIVWYRTVSQGTVQVWGATYNADGSVRSAPQALSGTFSNTFDMFTFETSPDGGFTAEHSNDSTGKFEIQRYTFDGAGNLISNASTSTVANQVGVSSDAFPTPPASGSFASFLLSVSTSTTVALPDGAFARAVVNDESGGPNFDIHLDLIDGATGQSSMTGGPQTLLTGIATGPNVDVAALGVNGGSGVALAYEVNGALAIGRAQLVATTTGDGFDNTIIGGEHVDVVFSRGGNDHVEGGLNDDRINLGLGDDFGDGGEGNADTLDYTGVHAVTIDLDLLTPQDTGGNGIDTVANFENLIGSREGDNLRGDEKVNNLKGMLGDDMIFGLAGNDVLEGGAGNDQLFGGDNEDLLIGGPGDDTLDGGASSILGDTASYAGSKGGVQVDLRIAGPQDTGGGGLDTLIGIENLIGTDGNDTLTGNNAARNELRGGNGKDTLFGDLGVDNLYGDAGIDYLFGGDSNDRLEGGTDRDHLTGGLGADQFHYVSQSHSGIGGLSDWIMDFNSTQGDKINLTTVFGGTLSYIGENEFTGTAGQLRVQEKATFQHVRIDLNGDGATDMDIRVMNGGITGAGDFVL